jgi:toxin ParE1/3/4
MPSSRSAASRSWPPADGPDAGQSRLTVELDEEEDVIALVPVRPRRVVDRIVSRADQIASFPESGRMVADFRSPRIREVVEKPYRIVYEMRPEEDRLEVVALFHGARLPPWLRDD